MYRPAPAESKRLSKLTNIVLRRSREQRDLFPLLVKMIEADEINVCESIQIVRKLRQAGTVVCVIDPEAGPQFRWAAGSHGVNKTILSVQLSLSGLRSFFRLH